MHRVNDIPWSYQVCRSTLLLAKLDNSKSSILWRYSTAIFSSSTRRAPSTFWSLTVKWKYSSYDLRILRKNICPTCAKRNRPRFKIPHIWCPHIHMMMMQLGCRGSPEAWHALHHGTWRTACSEHIEGRSCVSTG